MEATGTYHKFEQARRTFLDRADLGETVVEEIGDLLFLSLKCTPPKADAPERARLFAALAVETGTYFTMNVFDHIDECFLQLLITRRTDLAPSVAAANES